MNPLIFYVFLFALPLRRIEVTSPFGYRIHPVTGTYAFHNGVDLRARTDTVFAIMNGVVRQMGYDPFLGIYIRLDHGEFQSVYGHLSQFFVLPTDSVDAGQAIGITGQTGRVTGEHLHFSIQYHHTYIDPLKFLISLEIKLNQHKKEINK